jgi:hypothetical protein
LAISAGDFNNDGLADFVCGGTDGAWDGQVETWLGTGLDSSNRPQFMLAGTVGSAGTDVRGLAVGQVNSLQDNFLDVVFGNYEGNLYALKGDMYDSDSDGIINIYDNDPNNANAPRLDMNTDGGINYKDQLDNDFDELGDIADLDDDNDGIVDTADNCPAVYNPDQADTDHDGIGNACDCLNNADSDSDGINDGPIDPDLYARAKAAKGLWSKSDTHFIIRIDALGRAFQNEFIQAFADAAILSPEV